MNKSKKGRILVGCTVAGVLLLVGLVCIIVYQLVSKAQKEQRIADLKAQIEYYNSRIESAQDDLIYYQDQAYLDQMARAYGWAYPEDK